MQSRSVSLISFIQFITPNTLGFSDGGKVLVNRACSVSGIFLGLTNLGDRAVFRSVSSPAPLVMLRSVKGSLVSIPGKKAGWKRGGGIPPPDFALFCAVDPSLIHSLVQPLV